MEVPATKYRDAKHIGLTLISNRLEVLFSQPFDVKSWGQMDRPFEVSVLTKDIHYSTFPVVDKLTIRR